MKRYAQDLTETKGRLSKGEPCMLEGATKETKKQR
jgi:hypothetical protein